MAVVLYPRAAPSDRLRVWIGAFQRTSPPALTWQLNGTPQQPTALRPISSVRTDAMLPPPGPQPTPRAFTGVYEFPGLTADTRYAIRVQADGETAALDTRTLPGAVPGGPDRWLTILLASCFYEAEDEVALAGEIVSGLKANMRPHLSLLMGDQVYLDLPTLYPFRDDLVRLAAKFEADYTRNWWGPRGYTKVLEAAPSLSIPDDHEYWNNYPHPSVLHKVTYSAEGRDRWDQAAKAMYEGFQLPIPATLGGVCVLDVPPVSFCIADTRSGQDPGRQRALPRASLQQIEAWVAHVVQQQFFGIFAAGQSLFVEPTGFISGKAVDHELPDYQDYRELIRVLLQLVDAGRPLLCLTGDVHWGRVVAAQDITTGRAAIYEVISSPTSLVTTLGRDHVREGIARIARVAGGLAPGLFGAPNPWPRHSEAPDPPPFFASDVLHGRFRCATLHRQQGNHVALLRLRQVGGALAFRVTYWPIHPNRDLRQPKDVGPFELRPTR